MPGYIKNVGDHIRMRYVQPGYDPNSESVPPNKVIFDSDDLGTLAVIAKGSATFPSSRGTYYQLVTWDFPFVPLCWIQYNIVGNVLLRSAIVSNPVPYECRVNIRTDGIWVKGLWAEGQSLPVMHYTAFNVDAANG